MKFRSAKEIFSQAFQFFQYVRLYNYGIQVCKLKLNPYQHLKIIYIYIYHQSLIKCAGVKACTKGCFDGSIVQVFSNKQTGGPHRWQHMVSTYKTRPAKIGH